MLLDKKILDGIAAVRILPRRIEARIADELAEGIIEAYRPYRAVVIDFSHVDFIDSTGMKAIMTVLLHCRKTEGVCVLHGVSEDIMSIFVITRLNRLLPIMDSQAEAVEKARALMEESRRRSANI